MNYFGRLTLAVLTMVLVGYTLSVSLANMSSSPNNTRSGENYEPVGTNSTSSNAIYTINGSGNVGVGTVKPVQ